MKGMYNMALKIGDTIKLKHGQAKIKKEIGAGAQGTVYIVDYNGKEKALKWYHETYINSLKNPKAFYKNLENNIKVGSPSDMFLWPLDISKVIDGTFGYVMDLRPKEYKELTLFLLKETFSSTKTRIDAMLNLVNGFRILHNKGFSYQDLNNGNFFINPQNGDVLACDNDNVAYNGFNSGIVGKMRYMAPEVVLGKKMPDKATDRFSLSVILFMLACKSHPLEGKGSTPPCMPPTYEKLFYGKSPIFIFDPLDDSNRPIRGVHDIAIKMWPLWPEYIRELFIRSFSKNSMTSYNAQNNTYSMPRPIEKEWIDALVRARNCLVKCTACGNEEFVDNNSNAICSYCKRQLSIVSFIEFNKYAIPIYPGNVVYKCQLENCADDEALLPIVKVVSSENQPDNPYGFGLLNVSNEIFKCITTVGTNRNLEPNSVMPSKPGIIVNVSKGSFKII